MLLVITLGLMTGPSSAQLQTGNLYGTVTDNQGQSLPGATVTITGNGPPQVQVTNAQGQFRFLGLTPGGYQLTAALDGFSTVEYPNIDVKVGRDTTVEVTLTPAVEEVITVTSESPLLDERKISTGTEVTQTELDKIPTSREPWVVVQRLPGPASLRWASSARKATPPISPAVGFSILRAESRTASCSFPGTR